MDPRILRMSLVTRMQSAAVIACTKARKDLIVACREEVVQLKRAFDNEVPMRIPCVEHLERDCINAIHMSEVRARYARFSSGQPSAGDAPTAYLPQVGASFTLIAAE